MRNRGRKPASIGIRGVTLGVGLMVAFFVGPGQAFQQIKIDHASSGRPDAFGSAVSIDPLLGRVLAVGAPLATVNDVPTGLVHLFARGSGGGNWGPVGTLVSADIAADDLFGASVAATFGGLVVVVGAPEVDGVADSSGAAYLFVASNPSGPWTQAARLLPDDGRVADLFGNAVSVGIGAGMSLIVVGARAHDALGLNSGAAYVFEPDPDTPSSWRQVAKLLASDGQVGDQFGHSVAASGDVVIVGAPFVDGDLADAGAAYIFRRDHGGAGRWGEVVKLTRTNEERGEHPALPRTRFTIPRDSVGRRFGMSVAIAGNAAVVGAPGEDGLGPNAGAAYIFDRDRDGSERWGQVAEITASGAGRAGHYFGSDVAIDDDHIVVGARDDEAGTNAGAVYLFRRDQGGADAWGRVARILAFDAVAESVFGASVSVSASDSPTAVVGAPGGRPTAGNGEAYVLTDLQTLETHVPIGDSFVRRNHPDRNEGANPRLRINHSGRNRTVVEFAEIPAVANLRRATLVLTIAENSNNWGRDGGTVEAFQALSFPEGNGKAAGVPGSERTRGLGEGITWNCNVDLAIENDRPDCGEPSEVLGPLADPVLHFNGLRGEVAWDVTVDVMRHTRAWIIRKAEESRSGEVWYYSREGARDAGNPDLAPRLVLEFDVPAPRDAAAGAVETARNARPSWGPADPRRASPNEIARPRARRPGA